MSEHKRDICRAGLHPMSGSNLGITSRQRYCKACAHDRNLRIHRDWRRRARLLGIRFIKGRAVYPEGYIKRKKYEQTSDEELDRRALEWIERKDSERNLREFHSPRNRENIYECIGN
jgi:hypothetical protein